MEESLPKIPYRFGNSKNMLYIYLCRQCSSMNISLQVCAPKKYKNISR